MYFPRRIRPQSRPLRPPLTKQYRATRPRSFARHPHLYLVSPGVLRPQLSFLRSPHNARPLQLPLSRFLSTETKAFWKHQGWLSVKYIAIGTIITSCGLSWAWMLTQELVDREFPAPKEWSFLTKVVYHAARGLEVPAANLHGEVDWVSAGLAYRDLLARLENSNADGRGLVMQDDTELLARGIGHTGFDISDKSYEWRRGYYEALMGCGKAAIQLQNWVKDVSRDVYFERKFMIGPSNPKPKPLPPWSKRSAPSEENCVPAYEPPETFYLKVLTTTGFSAKEKMDAALAYGNWLDHRRLYDTGEEMFQWAIDLAISEVEKPSKMLDIRTGIIKPDARVTDNILDATTALAIHRAQAGDTNSALPIFLSVLRARRDAPLGVRSYTNTTQKAPKRINKTDIDVLGAYFTDFWSLLQSSKFPPPPPSGNDPFVRTTDTVCDEATIMMYVGEILYATSKSERDAGLSWTKSALDLAMTGYRDPRTSQESRLKCVDCLRVGLDNRSKMVERAVDDIKEVKEQKKREPSWKHWIPGLGVSAQTLKSENDKWDKEEIGLAEFLDMLVKGRVLQVDERPPPIWGSYLLREWLLPKLSMLGWA